jgi:hypothetical protein
VSRTTGISIDTRLTVIVLIAASCCLSVERAFDRTPVRSSTPSAGENPQLLRTGV